MARLVLCLVLLLGGAMLMPRPDALFVADASAIGIQVTPTLPNIIGTPTQTKAPDPLGGGGNGEGGGNNGGNEGGNNNGGNDGGGDGDGRGGNKPGDKKNGKNGKNAGHNGDGKRGKGKGKKNKDPDVPSIAGRIPGAFDTNKLVAVAGRLRALGLSEEEVIQRVYPPFIIAGPSSWIDTWGAPRYGPGPIVRTHEGQDVFCNYGDPILAPEDGVVDFSDGGLGGITARVHVPSSGRYWYMTHLSDLNTEQFSIGDAIKAGDVLGYCGNSGNAATTSPHVHFGWYSEGGTDAQNPMKSLVKWLHIAERRVLGVVTKTTEKRVKQQPTLTAARRFGDAFTPDLSELRIAGESLWASGSDPTSGAFAIAESALQAALAGTSVDFESGQPVDLIGAGANVDDTGSLEPTSALGRLLEDRAFDQEGSD